MTSHGRPAVPRFAVPLLLRSLVVAVACTGLAPSRAGAAPVDRKTLAGKEAMFVIFQTPEEGIGVPISLKGFGEGFDALP